MNVINEHKHRVSNICVQDYNSLVDSRKYGDNASGMKN